MTVKEPYVTWRQPFTEKNKTKQNTMNVKYKQRAIAAKNVHAWYTCSCRVPVCCYRTHGFRAGQL